MNLGLKQGCLISPQLFNLYISDLIEEIQNLGLGIPTDKDLISVLLYADDMALLAECETDLLQMLDILHEWCSHWKLKVNVLKSQMMHFSRGPSVPMEAYFLMYSDSYMMLLCNPLSTMLPLYGVIKSLHALALFNLEHQDTTLAFGKYAPNAGVLGEMGWQLVASP